MQQYITKGCYSETQQKYFQQGFMVPAHFPGLTLCLMVPCSSCLAERLLYSEEQGRRGRDVDVETAFQVTELEPGGRDQDHVPTRTTLVSPGYTDMKGAVPLCSVPSVEAAHEISLV